MKFASITDRVADLGGAKWDVYLRARDLIAQGQDVISLTIGEPDVSTPADLIDVASRAMRDGRTTYSNGRGEDGLRAALATYYSELSGQDVEPNHVLCFPGTQTALYAVMTCLAESGDEVLVGDPMYATYEGVIRSTGADMVPVPLRWENGFRISVDDIRERITPRSRVLLLTTPHNPTGAVLTREDLAAIGRLAKEHDLWIVSDEVYGELVFDGTEFTSALSLPEFAERTVVVSSISKSHAAPGFRSGWCIGPEPFVEALLPISENMLFGNQPFIADMTEAAIRNGSGVAAGMRQRFAARAELLQSKLEPHTGLRVHRPDAGMFAMVNVAETGMNGYNYALHLLENAGVAVMPGTSFGETINDWVRVALTVEDGPFLAACDRIAAHATGFQRVSA